MKFILINIINYVKLYGSSVVPSELSGKSIIDQLRSIKDDFNMNDLKPLYLVLSMILPILCAYILVNFIPISKQMQSDIVFASGILFLILLMGVGLSNTLFIIWVAISSIFGIHEANSENQANWSYLNTRNRIIPCSYYVFLFASIFFISFLILFCMHYTGVNYGYVFYLGGIFVLTECLLIALMVAINLFLNESINTSTCFNMKYNLLKQVKRK